MSTDGDLHTSAGPGTPSPVSERIDPDRLSIVGALNVLLQQRLLIATCAVVPALVVAAVLLLQHRVYTSTSSFIPQTRRTASSIAGLASQFGLSLPGVDPGQSPAFYSDLVMTREIIGAAVDARYFDPAVDPRDSVSLVEVLGQGPATPALRREAAIRKLRQVVTADVSLKSGSVNLSVQARYPRLAREVNQRILDLLNDFNLRKRQTQAGFERRFVEQRLGEVGVELRAAEDRLQVFLQRNKEYRASPSLTFEHDRLEREVAMRQQLYTSLAQAFEQAKIDEIRDSPLITIIEEPVEPVLPDKRGLVTKSLVALLAGVLAGFLLAFARYSVVKGRAGDPAELSRLRVLASETAQELIRPWRARRRQGPKGPLAS